MGSAASTKWLGVPEAALSDIKVADGTTIEAKGGRSVTTLTRPPVGNLQVGTYLLQGLAKVLSYFRQYLLQPSHNRHSPCSAGSS